jgi:hypothetical protein
MFPSPVFNKEAPLDLAEEEEKRSLNFVLISFFGSSARFLLCPFAFLAFLVQLFFHFLFKP